MNHKTYIIIDQHTLDKAKASLNVDKITNLEQLKNYHFRTFQIRPLCPIGYILYQVETKNNLKLLDYHYDTSD